MRNMHDPNENRQGYKPSKVGWIPEDWSLAPLQSCANFLDNQRVPIKEQIRKSRQGPYPYYGASGIIDYVDDYIFDDDLILLGEDGANIILRTTPLAFRAHGKMPLQQNLWVDSGSGSPRMV